jgi:DNA-binding beta-propeller fold protein YncE
MISHGAARIFSAAIIAPALGLLLLSSAPVMAQQAVPEIPFESIPDPLKLPTDLYFGEVTGVAVNSKGHVFVFSRGNTTGPAFAASAAQLLEFAADGQFIREIGKNLYAWSFAHAVRIDKDDNIWVIDKGSDMIIRFNPEGRVTMVFGRKQEASDEETGPLKHPVPPLSAEDGRFRQPTDVTFDPEGDIFISDGYINSRVAKADKNGNWIKSWGNRGNKPGEFNTPHNIAADAKGNIYVADRGNRRIQVFDSEGNFLRIMTIDVPFDANARPAIGNKPDLQTYQKVLTMVPGAPWTVCITPPPNQVLYTSDAYPGRVYKLSLDGKVLGMLGQSGKQLKQFGWVHEIACPSENLIYVAELLNWRVQKLILHPEQQKAAR